MNAHQPDGILLARGSDIRLSLGEFLRFNKLQKSKKTLALELIELLGEAEETLDICMAQRSAQLGPDPGIVMRLC